MDIVTWTDITPQFRVAGNLTGQDVLVTLRQTAQGSESVIASVTVRASSVTHENGISTVTASFTPEQTGLFMRGNARFMLNCVGDKRQATYPETVRIIENEYGQEVENE